jgi:hypothetical protein
MLRPEIRNYVRACEEFLSDHLEPRLTEEEQELIIYYLNELFGKFGHKPITGPHFSSFPARTPSVDIPKRRLERRRKLYTTQLQLEKDILNAVVNGEFELTAAEIEFVEILHEAVRSGATKVLIDGKQMTGNPADFERFLYGEFAAWATLEVMRERNVVLRFAYVIHQPLRDPARFGENVAVNRGMDVKTFEDTNAAIQWLNAA